MKSDIEIARSIKLKPISEIAESVGIPQGDLEPYGKNMAKVPLTLIDEEKVKKSKLVLVTAITPTKAGIGKTTVSVGLALGLNKIGKRAIAALREPSLGPCFGMKGGAAGGGYAQILPMEKINLHFTGDFHAITSANNMISALLDNYIYQHQRDSASNRFCGEEFWMSMTGRSDISSPVSALTQTDLSRSQDSTSPQLRKLWQSSVCQRIWMTSDAELTTFF